MMRIIVMFTASIAVLMSTSCSVMNTNFSCNKTAGDCCMTTEQVDSMTRFADDVDTDFKEKSTRTKTRRFGKNYPRPNVSQKNDAQSIWVSPYVDRRGNQHKETMLFAGRDTERSNA